MRLYAALFVIGLVVYGGLAGSRLTKQSAAPQFVYQADAWLQGQLHVDPPLVDNDWAKLETVEVVDPKATPAPPASGSASDAGSASPAAARGRIVTGRRMVTRPLFRTLSGETLPNTNLKPLGVTWYMSFPPFPTLLMLPSAAISGRGANDVIPTIILAALILPLSLLALRRLAAANLSQRTLREDLWLVATLAFGSVLLFSAIQGKVWYTAHVLGVVLALLYAWASIEAKHPIVAGLALGAAALTRTPMAFMFPLFLFEAVRMAGGREHWRAAIRPVLKFAGPVVAFALAGMIYNVIRFGSPTEFGHTYLDVRQQGQIEQWGLASFHYLSRNLAVAFTLLPEFPGRAPWIQISGHGLAIWVTTPFLIYALWPREKPPIHRALWITVAAVALPTLFYQNSGWVQFGYRFCLDYLVFLIMLLAIGGRPLTWLAKTLIVVGIAINLFGALTFDREWKYYRVGGNAYDTIIAH